MYVDRYLSLLYGITYNNYLAIISSHTATSIYGPLFCDYTGTRIRIGLFSEIDEPNSNIEYCHVSPTKYLNTQNCPTNIRKDLNLEEGRLCTVWIVGIKGNVENGELETILEKFSENILNSFNNTIDVKKKKVDQETYFLNTIYLTKEELMKWKKIN
ncbi:unnamed protein product [Meloidogyne enterolobii]|uniref:Uncharacterized protein n=1 Tax=Meloidogyne enterolobii TaxID=390850 RepID=A0ACB1AWK9_MELEN